MTTDMTRVFSNPSSAPDFTCLSFYKIFGGTSSPCSPTPPCSVFSTCAPGAPLGAGPTSQRGNCILTSFQYVPSGPLISKASIPFSLPPRGLAELPRPPRQTRQSLEPAIANPHSSQYPDLGALVVRRASGHILTLRRYFGGGTVNMVSTSAAADGAWHVSKGQPTGPDAIPPLHEGLEDGTLPFHSILALGEAMAVHAELYGSMANVSAHATALGRRLFEGVAGLRFANGERVCRVYGEEAGFGDSTRQGATVAFNVLRADGTHVSHAEVERKANEQGIWVRSGSVCCPGGVFAALELEEWHLARARSAGRYCGLFILSRWDPFVGVLVMRR